MFYKRISKIGQFTIYKAFRYTCTDRDNATIEFIISTADEPSWHNSLQTLEGDIPTRQVYLWLIEEGLPAECRDNHVSVVTKDNYSSRTFDKIKNRLRKELLVNPEVPTFSRTESTWWR